MRKKVALYMLLVILALVLDGLQVPLGEWALANPNLQSTSVVFLAIIAWGTLNIVGILWSLFYTFETLSEGRWVPFVICLAILIALAFFMNEAAAATRILV